MPFPKIRYNQNILNKLIDNFFPVLAVVTYNFFEYSEFLAIPVLEEFLAFVFSALPPWVEHLYIILAVIYILGGSIRDSAAKKNRSKHL
jgi:hypothetical protein